MNKIDTYMYGQFEDDVKELSKKECQCGISNPMVSPPVITLTMDRYDELIESERWLECLEQAGVGEWEGFELAEDIYDAFNG